MGGWFRLPMKVVAGLNSYVIPALAGGQRHGIYSCCGRHNNVSTSLIRLP